MMKSTFSVLINTCDKFEDCWNPFFRLWAEYWKDCSAQVYLNTEYKDYSYSELDIIPVKGCVGKSLRGRNATWSQCLRWALEVIDSNIILYLQEDYFLNGVVDTAKIEHYVKYLITHPHISCIQLSTAGIPVGKMADASEHLYYSNPNHFSYVSCQASLWRKDTLLDLLRVHETAWNFEWYGSKRAKYKGYTFLTLDHEWLRKGNLVIPYLATGIVGGRWNKMVVGLFASHDIVVDFTIRGFFNNSKRTLIQRLIFKIHFRKMKSEFEILSLKLFCLLRRLMKDDTV